jgi:hypothetical protein
VLLPVLVLAVGMSLQAQESAPESETKTRGGALHDSSWNLMAVEHQRRAKTKSMRSSYSPPGTKNGENDTGSISPLAHHNPVLLTQEDKAESWAMPHQKRCIFNMIL